MDDLKTLIESAFASTKYPGDSCLTDSKMGDEPRLLVKEFSGKNDWRVLSASFLDQAPDGYGSALSFFTKESFRFYLPAYLIHDLDQKLNRSDPVFHLIHGFTNKSKDGLVNPQRYGTWTWFEFKSEKCAVFDEKQVWAIMAYLITRMNEPYMMDYQKIEIEEAIENYWRKRHAELFAQVT